MVRLANMEMIVIKEEVYIHRSLEIRGMAYQLGPNEEAPGSVRNQREQEESMGESFYCGFCVKE